MKFFKLLLLLGTMSLTACGGDILGEDDNDNDNHDHEDEKHQVELPDGMQLVLIDSSSPKHYLYNVEENKLTDLNAEARSSSDADVQNLDITDGTNLVQFFVWNDVFKKPDETIQNNGQKVVLLNSMASEDAISHENLQYIAHYHGDEFAGHNAGEFDPANADLTTEQKEKKAAGLTRLNGEFTKEKAIFDEVSEALETVASDQTLCRAFVGGHHEEHHEDDHDHSAHTHSTDDHADEEHEAPLHFALTESGRIYFLKEENETLESTQSFVKLESIASIADCNKTSIAGVSEDMILVFVADTQMLYVVDSHGGDFHQHSYTEISDFMPAGFSADLVAMFGAGEEHDHDHDHDHDGDHDHDH